MKKEMRKIITIDEEKCDGCGLCVQACHEGAIALIDGKAKLMHEHYCDGLGDCLPACPTGAISFEEREAAAYDEAAVLAAQQAAKASPAPAGGGGCPGAAARKIGSVPACPSADVAGQSMPKPQSKLGQWPAQIKLVSPGAPYFNGADLLIAADCTAFAYGAFHQDFMAGKITIIGCPKLDDVDYSEKLSQIIGNNDITNITIARMEVPCCGGLEQAVKRAVLTSGKDIPVEVVTVSVDGQLIA